MLLRGQKTRLVLLQKKVVLLTIAFFFCAFTTSPLFAQSKANYYTAEAITQLKGNASNGNIEAMAILGSLHLNGYQVKRNIPKATQLLYEASIAGNPLAIGLLNDMHTNSVKWVAGSKDWTSEKKQQHAYALTDAHFIVNYIINRKEQIADTGNAAQQYQLALDFNSGRNVLKDNHRSFKWMLRVAQTNNPMAQLNLGLMYYNGLGTEVSFDEAFRWMNLAASQGNPVATFFLGTLYLDGEGVDQDSEVAASLLQKAADQGVYSAHLTLATMYETANGVYFNPDKAATSRQYVVDNVEDSYKDFEGLVTP